MNRKVIDVGFSLKSFLFSEQETQEEDSDDLLNTVAGQQVVAIEKMKK